MRESENELQNDREAVNELRSTTGMTKVEKLSLSLILVILAAIAIPVLLRLATEAQMKTNRINLRIVRQDALTAIQTGLGEEDSTAPDGRRINEGVVDGAGWAALAQVDEDNAVTEMKLFVVDDVTDYRNGITPGRVEQPVPVGSDVTFYEEPENDLISYPFARVKPTSSGNKEYTVQVVVSEAETDLVPVR